MIIDFLSIFLENFRGPRKTVFSLRIMRLISAGNHGVLRAKSTNFQSLVFIPKTEKLHFFFLNWILHCVFRLHFLVFSQMFSVIVKGWNFCCIRFRFVL